MLTGISVPKLHSVRYVGAKVYPTGEGIIYPLHRVKSNSSFALQHIREEYEREKEFWIENARLFGVRASCSLLLAIAELNRNLQTGRLLGARLPIESTSAAISHSHRCRKGSKGLSSHGRRLLRFAAATVEKRAGSPTALSFLTLTLPPMSNESWRAVLEGWGHIVRTFTQWLSRKLRSAGLPGHLVGCVELQTKRAEATGEPALHIHTVFQGRTRRSSWAVTPKQCRGAWKRAIEGQISERLEFANSENLTQVRKSAAKYLSKYMSKGTGEWLSSVAPEFAELHPCSWSFTPDALKRLYHSETWQGEEALAVLTLAINFTQYRHGNIVELPIYQLPNGQWVKVVLIKLERAFAKTLSPNWCA